ncbi:uncharacterized protein LOC105690293 [Athalia rosae]|uniref:uncharacterized protein LOC105690293 n=1 Tax=Athalia rosae TaxID=37344 RepID=UPI0006263110|nr:uncharacterized protein LOC105690293 [Athalia rosae]XP_048508487.1 uncharacterized protein LOC105690293 [Athalia rosae]
MSILEDREEYLKNPYFTGHEYGDFTTFYIVITICAVIGIILFVINSVFCWCSPWRDYWCDRHTGNRWIQSLWTNTPHKNPPLDLTELEAGLTTYTRRQEQITQYHHSTAPEHHHHHQEVPHSQQYLELQKRESEI